MLALVVQASLCLLPSAGATFLLLLLLFVSLEEEDKVRDTTADPRDDEEEVEEEGGVFLTRMPAFAGGDIMLASPCIVQETQ